MKKICFIAQFAPPMHGLSKAVETLYESELKNEFEFEKINITNNKKIISNLLAIKKSKADLFYFTISQSKGGNLRDLVILKAMGNRPCLIHLHGGCFRNMINDLPKWQKNANYRALKIIAGAIVLGPSLRWIFEGLINDSQIYTVSNCIDDEFMMSDEMFNEKTSIVNERKIRRVLYLSNFIRSKGYREVLEMVKIEKERVDKGGEKLLHFDFAGKFFKQCEEEYFWKYIKENKLEDYISYHGIVGGDKKRELLANCDFFILLTTYPIEGQPISILEAMGNGMVIVTTNHAGIPDVVTDGINGIVVDKKQIDVESIYQRIICFSKFKEVGINNRNEIKKNYSQYKYISEMKKLFCQIGGTK